MAKVEVTMPQMGESITEGTVIAWFKEPGDAVELDETLLEIGTDKVDTEVPSPAAGVLQEILVPVDETVDVGTVIAILETEAEAGGDSAPSEPAPADEEADAPAAEAAPAEDDTAEDNSAEAAEDNSPEATEAEASASAAPAEDDVQVVMPKMGESITEGTVLVWHKAVGDQIDMDETLLEIGTDKVDTEVPAPAGGIVKAILAEEGDTVEVGTPIAVIGSEASASQAAAPASKPAAPAAKSAQPSEPAQATSAQSKSAPAAPAEPSGPIERHGPDGRFYSPLVRSIAETEGVSMDELTRIEGSGREGRVTKEDVMAYIETRGQQAAPSTPSAPAKPAAAPRPAAPRQAPASARTPGERTEVAEMGRMRQIIADHMIRSKATSAHVTSFAEADVTNLVKVREHNKKAFQAREGVKLTYTPFFVHAAVEALKAHPIFNASVEGSQIIYKKDFHIGIAVALQKSGLVVPVIRDAGNLNLVGLARAAADLADRARSKQLLPDQLQGGTFTVTNIGSLGSLMGTPIINQPQLGILATGAIKKRPVVVEHPDLGDIIAIRHMMYISLSYDHRIIDGAMGSSYLHHFVQTLESYDPEMDV